MSDEAIKKLLWRHPAHFLALGLGSGLLPRAPGTWGSLAAVAIYPLVFAKLSLGWAALGLLLAFVVGVYLCGKCSAALGVHDHGAIVWDEFVGQWMVLLYICEAWNLHWFTAGVLAFGLFRLFDIVKPWPISWFDQHTRGGFGVMLDDVLAAGFGIGLLAIVQALW